MWKRLLFLVALIIVISAPFEAIAQTQQQTPDYGPGPWHMWAYGMPFWWMFPMMFLFLFVLCAVVFMVGRGLSGGAMHHWGARAGTWGDPTQSALQILNERYARGEIQKTEYAEKRSDILSK